MELIKKIKEAESKAAKIVEDAKKYASEAELKADKDHQAKLIEAGQDRKKRISDAAEKGSEQGKKESDQLSAQMKQAAKELEKNISKKIDSAVSKVVESVKDMVN